MLTGNKCASTALIFRHVFIIWHEQMRLALPQKVALCIITSQTFADTVCTPVVQDAFRALLCCRHTVHGTLCALIHEKKAHRLRFWQTTGVCSAQGRDEGGRCWIYCFQLYESNALLCLTFYNEKPLYFFFLLLLFAGKHEHSFQGNREQCQNPQVA